MRVYVCMKTSTVQMSLNCAIHSQALPFILALIASNYRVAVKSLDTDVIYMNNDHNAICSHTVEDVHTGVN
jgi:hypothetical protein